jgi:DNA polymerase-3 subunit delta
VSGFAPPGLRLDPPIPVYLVHGPEDLLRAEAVAAIEAAVLDPALADFNHDRFEGGACDAHEVAAAARTLPVMAERRLVTLRGIERMAPDALAPLGEYLQDPSPTTTLVLEGAKADLRRAPFPRIKQVGQIVACQPLYERDAARWVAERARGMGRRIEPEAARFLVDYSGTGLSTLASELEKAATYAGEGGAIDLEAVAETAGGGRVRTVFELTDALGERDASGALKALGTLLEGGEPPLRVQAMIVRHFRLLWRAREAMGNARDPGGLARALGVPPFVAGKLRAQAPRYREGELADAFVRFARVDFDLKGGASSPRFTLEDEVLALCSQRRGPGGVSPAR